MTRRVLGLTAATVLVLTSVPISVNVQPLLRGADVSLASLVRLSEARCSTCMGQPNPLPFYPCDECEDAPFETCSHTQAIIPIEDMRLIE